MSLAAVPAFFLARRVVREALALLAALLAVAIPSIAYTGTVMTENVFYPLFLLVALVLVLVLERPTPLLVALLLAAPRRSRSRHACRRLRSLRPILLAPFVLALFERRASRPRSRGSGWLYGIVAAAAPRRPRRSRLASGSLLGAYAPVGERSYEVGEALRYLWWHVAELSLYVLVIPLAATIVLVARARSLDARLQAFLAATVSLTVCLVPVVAAFASEFSDRIQERNLFYVAPLLCIALLAWVERGAPRPRVLAAAAAVASALLVVAIPFDRFITTSALTDTLMLLPFWSLQDRIGIGLDRARRARARGRARGGVPLRAPALCARAAAARPRPLDPRDQADLVGNARVRAVLARSALPGHPHGRPRLGRPARCRDGEQRRVPLDRADRPADGEPERVLQPRCRPRLLRHEPDARRAAGDTQCGSIRERAR